ncbi:30S ribosomal protein S12 methylthiotransferase RimO [Thioflexithrix psekupsensis]|uniref:Ribosomal protein uS12 methylthiotransferase RimO n=1 Tax=Thioflexithrix psekupsensis TaxID=1570016 RepID=A0A251X5I9_9GAMM|nr:30S ribosomal protein S12 methylthiotransferase RimO [Thioflexithrix psekupsensis]OUD12368.1 ribosomal protein S12 methylthiotransferase [Thioflexithrix psekupsensis]
MTTYPAAKIGFISLGCPKATVDSERILTQLRAQGYELGADYQSADVVVVNTCGFIDAAIEESLTTIGEALRENGRVIVTGCLGAQGELVKNTHPQVLAVTGPDALSEVIAAIHEVAPPRPDPFVDLLPPGGLKLTPRHYAYIKIAEGCNQKCSFCIIPQMRGELRSRGIGEVLNEAEQLVSAGVRELLIVAQDTAAYGVDTRYRLDFWQGKPLKTRIKELATHLGTLPAWTRLHYIYPYPHVDQLVELMAEGVILPYLDVPLQHANRAILKAMRRPADSENMLERITKWRSICPDLIIRSTFIVGFPGETEVEFNELLHFLERAQLDRVGAFAYSPVSGAAANALPGAVSEAVKQERLAAFMAVQSDISADRLARRVGQQLPVLIDEINDDHLIARSYGEAPEIDGVIVVPLEDGIEGVTVGDFIEIKLTHSDEHDLFGEIIWGDEA